MMALVAPSACTPCFRRWASRSRAFGLSHSIVRHPVTEYSRTTSDSLFINTVEHNGANRVVNNTSYDHKHYKTERSSRLGRRQTRNITTSPNYSTETHL